LTVTAAIDSPAVTDALASVVTEAALFVAITVAVDASVTLVPATAAVELAEENVKTVPTAFPLTMDEFVEAVMP
jgi:hypothetical protein